MTVNIAMYVGKGKIGNFVIRKWTGRKESHCELVVEGVAYSSSIMDKGVRRKNIEFKPENWELIAIPWADAAKVISHFKNTEGKEYGWLSLIGSQIFNRGANQEGADFCSEWCAEALGLPNTTTYSPGTLRDIIEFLNNLSA